MDAISATGAVVNALHVPERWFPGKMDYFLNGHTLMHIAAFLSLVVARQGFLCDMRWLNEVATCPSNHTASWPLATGNALVGILGTVTS